MHIIRCCPATINHFYEHANAPWHSVPKLAGLSLNRYGWMADMDLGFISGENSENLLTSILLFFKVAHKV